MTAIRPERLGLDQSVPEKTGPEQFAPKSGVPEKLGAVDQAAATAFEGEIREFVRRKVATSRRTNSRISPSKAVAAAWSTAPSFSGTPLFGANCSGPVFSGTLWSKPSRSGLMAVMLHLFTGAIRCADAPPSGTDCRMELGRPLGAVRAASGRPQQLLASGAGPHEPSVGAGRGLKQTASALLAGRDVEGAAGHALLLRELVGGQLLGLVLVGLRFLLFLRHAHLTLRHGDLLSGWEVRW